MGKTFNGSAAAAGDVVFELQTLLAVSQFKNGKFGLDEFGFDTTLTLSQFAKSSFKGLPGNWTGGIGGQNADGFGNFELAPNVNKGGANSVSDPLFLRHQPTSSIYRCWPHYQSIAGSAPRSR